MENWWKMVSACKSISCGSINKHSRMQSPVSSISRIAEPPDYILFPCWIQELQYSILLKCVVKAVSILLCYFSLYRSCAFITELLILTLDALKECVRYKVLGSQDHLVLSAIRITCSVMAQGVFLCPNNPHVKLKLRIFLLGAQPGLWAILPYVCPEHLRVSL